MKHGLPHKDANAHTKAIDKIASRVIGAGIYYQVPDGWGNECTGDLRPALNVEKDMVGKRFGRLVVIGPSKEITSKRGVGSTGTRWVVRCDCGAFERRKTRGLRRLSKRGQVGMCSKCKYVDVLKNGKL